jgi:hypothetical protein
MTQYWDKGVELELHGIGKYRRVTSTEEAARHLTGEEWPENRSPAFKAAVKACIEALENTRKRALASKARAAFIEAADDAGIHIRDK